MQEAEGGVEQGISFELTSPIFMMNRIVAALLLSSLPLFGGTVNVSYTFSDHTGNPQAVRRVVVTPLSPLPGLYNSSNILFGIPIERQTDTSGGITISNLAAGYNYRVQLLAANYSLLGVLTNSFPTNASGSVYARDYMTISTNLGNGLYAYSQAQSDARFQPLSTNLTGWSLIPTNQLGSGGGGTGQTNWPYTAITNSPWVVNSNGYATNLTIAGTISGNGSGLTNLNIPFTPTNGMYITSSGGYRWVGFYEQRADGGFWHSPYDPTDIGEANALLQGIRFEISGGLWNFTDDYSGGGATAGHTAAYPWLVTNWTGELAAEMNATVMKPSFGERVSNVYLNGTFIGDGSGLTNIHAASVAGTLTNAVYAANLSAAYGVAPIGTIASNAIPAAGSFLMSNDGTNRTWSTNFLWSGGVFTLRNPSHNITNTSTIYNTGTVWSVIGTSGSGTASLSTNGNFIVGGVTITNATSPTLSAVGGIGSGFLMRNTASADGAISITAGIPGFINSGFSIYGTNSEYFIQGYMSGALSPATIIGGRYNANPFCALVVTNGKSQVSAFRVDTTANIGAFTVASNSAATFANTVTVTNGVALPALSTPPTIAYAGAVIWSDGTNICATIRTDGGTLTTNKLTMTAWP